MHQREPCTMQLLSNLYGRVGDAALREHSGSEVGLPPGCQLGKWLLVQRIRYTCSTVNSPGASSLRATSKWRLQFIKIGDARVSDQLHIGYPTEGGVAIEAHQ